MYRYIFQSHGAYWIVDMGVHNRKHREGCFFEKQIKRLWKSRLANSMLDFGYTYHLCTTSQCDNHFAFQSNETKLRRCCGPHLQQKLIKAMHCYKTTRVFPFLLNEKITMSTSTSSPASNLRSPKKMYGYVWNQNIPNPKSWVPVSLPLWVYNGTQTYPKSSNPRISLKKPGVLQSSEKNIKD